MPIDKKDCMLHMETDIWDEGKGETGLPKHWKPKHIHMYKLHDNVKIGWRGPMMLWSKLSEKYNDDVVVFF